MADETRRAPPSWSVRRQHAQARLRNIATSQHTSPRALAAEPGEGALHGVGGDARPPLRHTEARLLIKSLKRVLVLRRRANHKRKP